MAKFVTLITTEALSPYNKNEVFSVTEREAEALLNPVVVNENGKSVKIDSKVEVFDAKREAHAAALVAQRGKTKDVEPEEDGAATK